MNLHKTIPVQVRSIHQETPHVKRFPLVHKHNEPLPYCSGGSHITTYVELDGQTIARSYSLTNPPGQTAAYQIAIRLIETSQGGSLYWHERMKVGDMCIACSVWEVANSVVTVAYKVFFL
ncbi:MAG: FAD-binding oxidoreductase [Bacillota bacterium]